MSLPGWVPVGDWPAIEAARLHRRARVALWIDGLRVGSVAETDLPALTRWPLWLHRDDHGLHLIAAAEARDDALAEMNDALHAEGLIHAWRDERFGLIEPASGAVLATFERASCRFWGTLTRGAHCTGYTADPADPDARPVHLWIARRSPHKATDPGMLDNLVGGGVPHGQSPLQTLWREGWEEAGLSEPRMRLARPGRVIGFDCDVREGRMVEHIHAFDLALPPGLRPMNQDGEVAEFIRMPVEEVIARAAAGELTTDAALVTLDFLLRHGLLDGDVHARLFRRTAHLWVGV